MGLTCKPCGKLQSMFAKLENEMNGKPITKSNHKKKVEAPAAPTKKKRK